MRMFLLVECAMNHEIKNSIYTATKIILGLFILIYFGASLVICDEDLAFHLKSVKELEDDVKDWEGRCLNETLHDLGTPCCNAEKEYNQNRRRMQRRTCFYKGIYPEPYIFISSGSEIKALDLLTHDATVVVDGLGNSRGLAIHIEDKKLYFGDGSQSISRANLDGSGREVILKNAKIWKMAIDWIGRRILWTKYPREKRIFVVNMDGKHRRTLINTQDVPDGIAVDPLTGYLFWTEYYAHRVQRMNLATRAIVTLANSRYPLVLSLDYTNKRVYWISQGVGIFASDYDGVNTTNVRSGSFDLGLLGLLAGSVYFQERKVPYINEMNISSGNISRKFEVNKADNYRDMVVVHKLLQPKGECSTPCGPFSYCNKSNDSCQCEVGFEMKENTCTDIDECSSSQCGRHPNITCTNFPGFYKCSCDEGFVYAEKTEKNKTCIGPTPYLLINTEDEIHAVHLLTKERAVVQRGLVSSSGIAVDTVEMKLYFGENNFITWGGYGISMRNISDADVNAIITKANANVEKMAIDWIGRRIFWTQSSPNQIRVANLDGKEGRVVTITLRKPRGIAIDSLSGFLFWTEDGVIIRLNLADGVKVTLVTNTGTVNVIKLDCMKKRAYWLESSRNIRHIKSSDYGGKDNKTITSGPFNEYLLGVIGDSLYFLNTSEYRIHEMNVSSGNISRKILVDNANYCDLTVVYKSFQLTGECSMSCGPFGYCNKYNDSCQCRVGFEMKENTCKDINECLAFPCGPNATKKCINLQGSYKCSACDEGFSLYQNPLNEGRCVGPTPYLLINSWNEMHAVHLLTKERAVIQRGLGSSSAIAVDTVGMMLYFEDEDNRRISMRNISDADVNVIIENANVKKMAIDWIGRRIFWTQSYSNQIHVANLDGKEGRVVTNTMRKPRGIAIDSLSGFLFWTEFGAIMRRSLADNITVILVANAGNAHAIKLDITKKRVYWMEVFSSNRSIKSCDYGGKEKKTITSGQFNEDLLGVLGDSLYFLNTYDYRITEMNVSNGNISWKILVDNAVYLDLVVVDQSVQPAVVEECFNVSCGPFGYCDISSNSCQCVVGLVKNGTNCTDINECLSLPCGPNATKKCINLHGSYNCSACDEGFLLYQNALNEGRCVGPTPYLLINTKDEIHAVHLLTKERAVVEKRGRGDAIAVDTVEMKLYFEDDYRDISMRNIGDADVNVIITNANKYANVEKMAIDWIGRRIFWTQSSANQIRVANLDGKEERVVTITLRKPRGIAIDSLTGFLFWTEVGAVMRRSLADNITVILVANAGSAHAIKLDITKKRVYWMEVFSSNRFIKSCDYGGKEKKTITSGPFNEDLLGVSGDSVYFLNTYDYRITEMNVSNGNILRKILVDNADYRDLVVVDKSIQPAVVKECFNVSCGPFGYCDISSNSCQCVVGLVKNGTNCTDINECLSLPCGPNATKKCINLHGSYQCSACDEGFLLYRNSLNEGRCVAYSDLQIKLVKSENNKTGTIQIYHPSFGWGTVCGGWRWTKAEGNVVCRQLGFTGVNVPRKWAHYGQGSGAMLLGYVGCTGEESYIWDCKHRGWNVHLYCDHGYDAGVDCY